MKQIRYTQPYRPNRARVNEYLDGIWERAWFTNNGPLVQELTNRLEDYLGVENLLLVANGTLALQVAIAVSAGSEDGYGITTPFSFIATASALDWERRKIRFVDIDEASFNLDAERITPAIVVDASAVVPVHVFGNPCDVERFDRIQTSDDIPIIYDAAHAFGVRYKKKSVLSHGAASILSFHATKLFHTVEGGAIVFRDSDDHERAMEMINFGHRIGVGRREIVLPGLNAKMSEIHAAVGLANLDEIDSILDERRYLKQRYLSSIGSCVDTQYWHEYAEDNGAYCPVLMASTERRNHLLAVLQDRGIEARPYFYPALNEASGFRSVDEGNYAVTSDIASRILCLPLFNGLSSIIVDQISDIVREVAE